MKSPVIFICLLLCCKFSIGQSDSVAIAQPDTLALPVEAPPRATFTIGAAYANDASYYGQKAADKTAYVAIAAEYTFKSGFYLTGLAYKLLNDSSSGVSATNLGVGVNFKLGKRFLADISYNHSFYPALSPLLQAGNADNTSISLTYEKWLKAKVSGDYVFGKTDDVFATAGVSKMINLFSISRKDIVTLAPSVDVVAGTQHFYSTYTTQQKVRDSILGILPPILGGGNPAPGSGTTTVSSTSFDIISYNIKLPLAYNRSRYLLEAAYQLSFLSNKAQSNPGKTNSFGTLSFYYQF